MGGGGACRPRRTELVSAGRRSWLWLGLAWTIEEVAVTAIYFFLLLLLLAAEADEASPVTGFLAKKKYIGVKYRDVDREQIKHGMIDGRMRGDKIRTKTRLKLSPVIF